MTGGLADYNPTYIAVKVHSHGKNERATFGEKPVSR